MHHNANLILDRLERALATRLRPARTVELAALDCHAWQCPGEPVPFAHAVTQDFEPVAPGTRWGRPWSTVWFRLSGGSQAVAGTADDALEIEVDLGFIEEQVGFQCEALAYDASGRPIKAINPKSRWLPAGPCRTESGIEVYVEAAANPVILRSIPGDFDFSPTPLGDPATCGASPHYRFGGARLLRRNDDVSGLVTSLEILGDLARTLPADSHRRWSILRAIDESLDEIDAQDVAGTAAIAAGALADVLASPAHASAHELYAVGHAHIDSAWMWPFRETRRKVARTVANVLQLMDEDPDLIYAMSSAQQFAWLREDQPELFEQVRRRVREGRFVPVGGMWVEPDTSMPSGESLVRHFLLGGEFFRREFGVATDIGWLPDSFGYSAALPQILVAAGARRFLTQKISWNSINRFPHHTFWWEGLDGSRVFTHFPSADMYNSALTVGEVDHAARNFADKGWASRSLIPFGYGDGGGGPVREMMARGRTMANLEGAPRVRFADPATFFDDAQAEYRAAPTWRGELYLEFHRGIFTSQAGTKVGNRRAEAALRQAEAWATTAEVRTGATYPLAELNELWQTLALMQFHDVLPGSSIAWVHDEAERELRRVRLGAEQITRRALADLAPGWSATASPDAQAQTLLANGSGFGADGVAPYAIGPRRPSGSGPVTAQGTADGGYELENDAVRVAVSGAGLIAQVTDKRAGRDVLAGPAGHVTLHPDTPARWDAWDLEEHYRHRQTDMVPVSGPNLSQRGTDVVIASRHRIGDSPVRVEVSLTPDSPAVEISYRIEWREREKLAKAHFLLALSAETWEAETQFGAVTRPTHSNTSWDAAKFEACAQRWVRVAEPDFAVALVNDSTYGYCIHRTETGGTSIAASLLRAPAFPDPDTDRGEHTMRFALVPGALPLDCVRHAEAMEGSVLALTAGEDVVDVQPAIDPLIELETQRGAIAISAIKSAQDGSGDAIVRLYEPAGARAAATVRAGFPCEAIAATGIDETLPTGDANASEPVNALAAWLTPAGSSAELAFTPFQFRTLRFVRKAHP